MTLIYNRSIKRNINLALPKLETDVSKNVSSNVQSLITQAKAFPTNNEKHSDLDLVYIVRPGEINNDLRYSLRSVSKFCAYRKIWIIGFKPRWVGNVKYIHTEQNQNKWKNSMINYLAACNTPEISENFILMNDDFFAIRPVDDWIEDCNACLGSLEEYNERFITLKNRSKWQYGFEYAINLLNELKVDLHNNYELHMPMIINKQKFIDMMWLPEIQKFSETRKVFHKRSIYKNLYPDDKPPRIIQDVKLELYKDLQDNSNFTENWISTYDDCVCNKRYPKLNYLLTHLFPKPCKYEKPI